MGMESQILLLEIITRIPFQYCATNVHAASVSQNSVSLSAPESKSNKDFILYPNPATDILHVQTNGNASFSLLNQSGQILLTTNINGKGSINISGMSAGLYYLKNTATG